MSFARFGIYITIVHQGGGLSDAIDYLNNIDNFYSGQVRPRSVSNPRLDDHTASIID